MSTLTQKVVMVNYPSIVVKSFRYKMGKLEIPSRDKRETVSCTCNPVKIISKEIVLST